MGQKSSRTAPEHLPHEEDRHSAWGSDIDATLCGPGTICADDWTPMNSLPATPESQRRRLSDIRIEDDVITEQPSFEKFRMDDDNVTNFDVVTVHELDSFDIPPVLVAPVVPRKKEVRRKKAKKGKLRKKKLRRTRKRSLALSQVGIVETPVLRSYNKSRQIRHVQKHRPRRHHIIHVRRIRIHQDPRYPTIPPPQTNYNLKFFRRGHPDDMNRFAKAVPPRHLKGTSVSTKPHFRYRGIPKIIV